MWNILICDDDKIFLNRLKTDILDLEEERVKRIELFSDAEQFKFFIAEKSNEANIIIMDVKLETVNGIELAKQILELQPNSQIIFNKITFAALPTVFFTSVNSVSHNITTT